MTVIHYKDAQDDVKAKLTYVELCVNLTVNLKGFQFWILMTLWLIFREGLLLTHISVE